MLWKSIISPSLTTELPHIFIRMLFLLLFPRFSRRVSIIKCLTKFSTVCNCFPPHQRKRIKHVLVFILFCHALHEATICNILQVCSFKDTDICLFYIYIYKYFALKKTQQNKTKNHNQNSAACDSNATVLRMTIKICTHQSNHFFKLFVQMG